MPEEKAEIKNDYGDTVWVSKQGVKEVDGQVGFVSVSLALAKKLIKEGKAQDPNVGGLDLNYIEGEEPIPKTVKKNKPTTPPKVSGHKPAAVAKNIKPGGKVQKVITQEDETTKSVSS